MLKLNSLNEIVLLLAIELAAFAIVQIFIEFRTDRTFFFILFPLSWSVVFATISMVASLSIVRIRTQALTQACDAVIAWIMTYVLWIMLSCLVSLAVHLFYRCMFPFGIIGPGRLMRQSVGSEKRSIKCNRDASMRKQMLPKWSMSIACVVAVSTACMCIVNNDRSEYGKLYECLNAQVGLSNERAHVPVVRNGVIAWVDRYVVFAKVADDVFVLYYYNSDSNGKYYACLSMRSPNSMGTNILDGTKIQVCYNPIVVSMRDLSRSKDPARFVEAGLRILAPYAGECEICNTVIAKDIFGQPIWVGSGVHRSVILTDSDD